MTATAGIICGQGYGFLILISKYFSFIVAVNFIGGRNQSTQRKPPVIASGCISRFNNKYHIQSSVMTPERYFN